jgi:hypothetical protein
VPFQAALVTLTAPEEAVRVPLRFWLLPTLMLPKLIDDGLTARVAALVPVPDSGTDTFGSVASLTIEILPLAAAALAGVNATLTV